MPLKEKKIEKMFFTMGEVAQKLNESVSLVRFWADKFPKLFNPQRNKKGNRLFSPNEMEDFIRLHHLVKTNGMKLESAADRIAKGEIQGESKDEILKRLISIREMLSRISQELN